jgi:hypothetical protein
LVIKNGCGWAKVAKQAAETHGFAVNWGGHQLQGWNQQWVKERILPVSRQGRHAKIDSLLNDPAIAAELSLYLRSNKWAMNPDFNRETNPIPTQFTNSSPLLQINT